MRKIIAIGFFLLFVAGFVAVAEEGVEEVVVVEEEKKSDFLERTGFIFDTNNILFDIEGYQGGVGFKYRGDSLFYRTMIDFSFSSSTNKMIVGRDLALEKHLRTGKISPYWGVFFHIAYESEKFESDPDNWSKLIEYPISTGAILGVEVFLMDFLSFFVEYNLALQFVGVTNQQSVAGVVTESTTWNYSLSTGIGNNSKLGIVIYLDDIIALEKKESGEIEAVE